MVKFGGEIGTLYQIFTPCTPLPKYKNSPHNVQTKGGGSKAFWTKLKKTALFSHVGFPYPCHKEFEPTSTKTTMHHMPHYTERLSWLRLPAHPAQRITGRCWPKHAFPHAWSDFLLFIITITLINCSKPSNTSKWLRGRGGDTQPTPSCELLSTQSIPLSSTPSPSPPPQLSQLSPPWPQPLYRARTLLVVTVNRSTWSLPPTTWCKAWPSAIPDQGPRWTVSMMMVMIWWWWWWWAHEFWAVIFHGSNWRCAPKRSWWLNSRHLEFRARHCHVIIALPWLPPSLLVLQFSPTPVEIVKWFLHFIPLSFARVKFTSISIAYIYDPFVASVYIADFFMRGF